jgi:hypothetical protein
MHMAQVPSVPVQVPLPEVCLPRQVTEVHLFQLYISNRRQSRFSGNGYGYDGTAILTERDRQDKGQIADLSNAVSTSALSPYAWTCP